MHKTKIHFLLRLIFMVHIISFVSLSKANSDLQTDTDLSIPPEVIVKKFSNKLIQLYKINEANYKKNPQLLFKEINNNFSHRVAFNQIARYIMGKHAQKNQQLIPHFSEIFKNSLYSFYGNILLATGGIDVKITSISTTPKHILELYNSGKINRIQVTVSMQSNNQKVDILYSMIRSNKQWKLRNIIVGGFNIAHQFKNQFSSAVSKYNSTEYVVNNWNAIMQQKTKVK